MNAERWRKAREIFDGALETDPGERDTYVLEACGGDQEMRDTVERLLADATEGDPSWLESGASEGLVRRALEKRSLEGQRIDDFVIRGVLGSGGMATVFEAEQQHPRRTVALKVMRFGLLSDTAQRRFEYESEVLAGLRHPGIAQVYATGTYDDSMSGQELPYFAMELVEGARTLNRFVQEEESSLADTLRLFVTICQAVQYGHQRGFIHRDLKPQNILVDDRGRPKIIDFGIARATGPGTGEQTLYTQQGEILGTLHYMSPEQIDPDDNGLDIRCDVYALGVILFELIAGRLPFDLEGKQLTTVATVILHQEPSLPSSHGSRFSGTPQSEDLDWVILKAMDKDRDRRYASAAELAADLERILADEPILARPRTRLYLSKKFIKRHRVAVSAAAIVLVSLIAGITMTSIGLGRARVAEQEARDSEQEAIASEQRAIAAAESEARAAEEARLAEAAAVRSAEEARAAEQLANEALAAAELEVGTHKAVNDFLTRLLTSANPYVDGRDVKVMDVLEEASRVADELYGDRPQWAVAVANQLGNTFVALGQVDRGRSHLEKGVGIARDNLDPKHHVTLTVIHNLGTCYLGLDMLAEAESLLTEALAGRVETLEPGSQQIAETTIALAQVAYKKGEFDTAATRFTQAREVFLELLPPGSRPVVQATAGLGVVLEALGRRVEAEDMYRLAIENGEPELGPEHPSVLSARQNLATLLSARGELAEAIEMLQAILEVEERVMGPNHTRTLTTLNSLATALQMQGRLEEAEEKYRDLIARRRQAGQYAELVTAAALNNLGVCLQSQDRLEEAQASIEEALGLLGQMRIPESHWLTAAFRKAMAVVRIKQGRYGEAETMLKESIAVFEASTGDQSARIRAAIEAMVTLYEAWEKPELAQEMRERLARSDR